MKRDHIQSSDGDDFVKVSFEEVKHVTDKAYLFIIDAEDIWLPKSQVSIDEDDGVVYVPRWLAEEKELI